MSDNLPRMDYRQHRRARRLVHECCNYDEGNCLLLDDGEPCVCVQSISYARKEDAHSGQEKGHGLGLAIVRSIAEVHGGKAYAQNRENGVEFFLEIPAT